MVIGYSTNGPMSLYALSIMNTAAALNSVYEIYPNACNVPVPSSSSNYLIGQISASSYPTSGTFSVTLPQGGYTFVMVAALSNQNPTATLTNGYVTQSGLNVTTGTESISSTITGVTTFTFSTQLEVAFTQTYGSWIVAAIVISVIVLLAVYLTMRLRMHNPVQATLSQFTKTPTSCIKCGAELTPASEFCNKCGTKQN
jgi:hypothetical protein